jgi:hypothetical protein
MLENPIAVAAERRAALQELVDELTGKPFVEVDGRKLLRIAGGRPDDDAEDDSDDSDDDEVVDEADDEDDSDDDDSDDDDDEDGDGYARLPRSEVNRLRRIAADADKARKKAEREAAQRREREARDRGEFDELLQERDERVAEIEAERDEARYQLEAHKRELRVRTVANRMHFRDADDLLRFVSDDETETEKDIERAARRILREKPYLRSERSSTGMPGGGSDEVDGLTLEDIRDKDTDWVNANWDRVQKVLAASGQSASALGR